MAERGRLGIGKGRARPLVAAGGMALCLGGCTAASPSLPLFGAYFPFWLFCATGGIIAALIIRAVFIRLGIDEAMPWRLLTYTCLAAMIGFIIALGFFGR